MKNVKTYKDGDRFVLVVENCTGELKAKVAELVLGILDLGEGPTELPHLSPIRVADEKVPEEKVLEDLPRKDIENAVPKKDGFMSGGRYDGKSFADAIRADGVAAAIYMLQNADAIAPGFVLSLKGKCKEAIGLDVWSRDPDTATAADFEGFVNLYGPLIGNENALGSILAQAGYSDISDFIAFAGDTMIKGAYEALLEAIRTAIE